MKYVHTNLITRDWRRLSKFYCEVFGCVPVPPERNLRGRWLDDATGIQNAHIMGVHLKLPGYDNEGPTLEIFQYNSIRPWPEKTPDSLGFSHIAFAVEDIEETLNNIMEAGGTSVGAITEVKIEGAKIIRFVYARDPEGNIIEVQQT